MEDHIGKTNSDTVDAVGSERKVKRLRKRDYLLRAVNRLSGSK